MKDVVMRVARACSDLDAICEQYQSGLSLEVLSSWCDHDGYDGVILGHQQALYHLEFTHDHHAPGPPRPHEEQLLVFYVADQVLWRARCDMMIAAGFRKVPNANPYWERNALTFEDAEGGRVVLHRGDWLR